MDVNAKLLGSTLDYAGLWWVTLGDKFLVIETDVAQRSLQEHSFFRLAVMRSRGSNASRLKDST
jgi:hypothetical protein